MTTRTLQIDGQAIHARFIGKGLFSKAYRYGDTVYLLTENDYSKEAVALFAQGIRHIPVINRHADIDKYQVFSMPFYQRLTKKHFPEAYQQWKALNTEHIGVGLDTCQSWLHERKGTIAPSLYEALEALIYAFSNYEANGMGLEFNKVNVSVGPEGELILRDCLVSATSARQMWERKDSRRRRRFSNYN